MNAATIGASTFELRDAANALVRASVSYDGATRTATLTPAAALAASTTYTATLRGGTTDPRVKDAGRQRPRGQRCVELHDRRGAAAAELPVQRLERVDDADHAAGVGPERGRARRQVPTSIDGFITGVRFYKGDGQHRHPCRQPVDARRRAARVGHLQRRDGVGLAAGELREPGPGHREHGLCRVVLRAERELRGRPRLLRHERRQQRPGQPAQQRRRRRQRRLQLPSTTTFPSSTFNATNYWVDVVFSDTGTTPPDTTPPTVSSVSPAAGATGVATSTAVTRDLQRSDGCGDDRRVDLRAARCGQRARRVERQLRRADADRDASRPPQCWRPRRPTPRRCAAAAPA